MDGRVGVVAGLLGAAGCVAQRGCDPVPAPVSAALMSVKEAATFLGAPCVRGHVELGGAARRYLSSGSCVECVALRNKDRERKGLATLAKARARRERERGNTPTFLGKRCKHGHNDESGRALRFVTSRNCVVCRDLANQRRDAGQAEERRKPAAEVPRRAVRPGHILAPESEYRFETPPPALPTREMMMRRR